MDIFINSNKYGIQKCIIDNEDWINIKEFKFIVKKTDYTFYVRVNSGIHKGNYLHRILMGNPIGFEIDHENHNGLDNRKSNLRIATKAQNVRNRKISKVNTSSFKGVKWVKDKNAWQVSLEFNGKRFTGGYFDCKVDAAHKYNEMAIKYFGEFAYLNTITPEQEAIRLNEKHPPVVGMRRKSKCLFKGVDKLSDKCYAARISLNGKKKHLGCFRTAEEAALAYNFEAIKNNRDLNKIKTQ